MGQALRFCSFLIGVLLSGTVASSAMALTADEQRTIAAYDGISASVIMVLCHTIDLQTGDEGIATGSGFALGNGTVVTDYHVIEDAIEIKVVMGDDQTFPVSVIGTAPGLDIALLKMPDSAPALPPAPLGSVENLRVGQQVFAIGSPYGSKISISSGIISGLRREFFADDIERHLIQFDASVNPGQSGGPLIDSDGRAVGVIIAKIEDGESIGFATPIDRLVEVIPDLMQMGHPFRAEIGIQGVDISAALATLFDIEVSTGFLIEAVDPNSAASAAGLASGHRVVEMGSYVHTLGGDIILAANGINIEGGFDLSRIFRTLRPGAVVDFLILRNGEKRTITLTIPPMSHWHKPQPSADDNR